VRANSIARRISRANGKCKAFANARETAGTRAARTRTGAAQMKLSWTAAVVAFSLASLGAAAPTALRGYTPADSANELRTESQFVDMPTAQSALDAATVFSARPHYAGTPADYRLAIEMRDRLRAAGISAELEPFSVPVDTPRELVLELAPGLETAPQPKRHGRRPAFPIALTLAETAEPSDPATAERAIGLPFNAGSGDGDIIAPLVFANRGTDDDYQSLARAGVEVSGSAVLIRYGAQFRGLLAERAQARGAAGIIFYSDPKDDGSARGLVYPNGPWRPVTAVERGWVGPSIHVPTLPISAANAQILLASLRGAAGPAGWGGALPVDYPLARGPGRVHLIVKMNRKPTTLWNTIGTIAGVDGAQRIVLGAHRDAWVYGAGDNAAGVATLLEAARGFGLLVRGGWRPARTLVIAGWDGEEIGMAGSQAYAQRHAVDLARGCFAYLDADETVTGPAFVAAAAAAIAPLVAQAARAVRDPSGAGTVYDRWAAQAPRTAPLAGVPGGGDAVPFLAGSGTPVAALNFRGPFGAYHASDDTLLYATRFSDPDFSLHRAAAQLYGIAALRLADAGIVPYAFSGYAPLLRAGSARASARAARSGLAVDPRGLTRAIDRFSAAAAVFDGATPRGRDAGVRELRAARTLDLLIYGTGGDASRLLPDLDSAVRSNDARKTGAALARAGAALDAATAALGSAV
jgi:N-acetylated-alpha-linked acidic dipeptidase